MAVYEVNRRGFLVSDEQARMDVPMIHHFLSKVAYWSLGLPLPTLLRAMENSVCFGIYHEGQQVGFCRVVTDKATFAWIADVFVLETYRGRGLASWMIEVALKHPGLQGLRRWSLATKDAFPVYSKAGFSLLSHPERWMEIHFPGIYHGQSPDPV